MEEQMVYKEEWLNPESPKYYKGYRYEKDEDGDEIWFDENDVERKEISYYSNGNKCSEIYYNENYEIHNENGYAYQYWNRNGELKLQYYYLNDYQLTEEEWKEQTNPNYYKGYRYEKDKYGTEFWYDDNGNCRKEIVYYDNGNKSYEHYYNENGMFHNEDGFAHQGWYKNGEIWYQEYHINGERISEKLFNYIKSLRNK